MECHLTFISRCRQATYINGGSRSNVPSGAARGRVPTLPPTIRRQLIWQQRLMFEGEGFERQQLRTFTTNNMDVNEINTHARTCSTAARMYVCAHVLRGDSRERLSPIFPEPFITPDPMPARCWHRESIKAPDGVITGSPPSLVKRAKSVYITAKWLLTCTRSLNTPPE